MIEENVKKVRVFALFMLAACFLAGSAWADGVWIDIHSDQEVIETDDSFEVLISGGNDGDTPVTVDVFIALIDCKGDFWFFGPRGTFSPDIAPWVSELQVPAGFGVSGVSLTELRPWGPMPLSFHGRYMLMGLLVDSGDGRTLASSRDHVFRVREGEELGSSFQNYFGRLLFTSDGRAFWAPSSDGLYLIDRATGNYVSYGWTEGIPSEANRSPAEDPCRNADGTIWVEVIGGLAYWDGDHWVVLAYEDIGLERPFAYMAFSPWVLDNGHCEMWFGKAWYDEHPPFQPLCQAGSPGAFRGITCWNDLRMNYCQDAIRDFQFDANGWVWARSYFDILFCDGGSTFRAPRDRHGDTMPLAGSEWDHPPTDIKIGPDNLKWIPTRDYLIVFNDRNWEVIPYPDEIGQPDWSGGWGLDFDSAGIGWLFIEGETGGSSTIYLVSFDPNSSDLSWQVWSLAELGHPSLSDFRPRSIVIDPQDGLWVDMWYYKNGVLYFNGVDWTLYKVGPYSEEELAWAPLSVR